MAWLDGESTSRGNPWMYAAGGAAGGAAAVIAAKDISAAKSRANWALAIALGIGGLMLINSGNLNTQATNAQTIAQATNALTFDAAVTGIQVAGLRAQVVSLANTVAQGLYYANPFGWFNNQPVVQPVAVQITAVTTTVATTSNNNNGVLIIALVGIGIAAVALSNH